MIIFRGYCCKYIHLIINTTLNHGVNKIELYKAILYILVGLIKMDYLIITI